MRQAVLMAPFFGLLLTIALLPALAPDFWRRHYTKAGLFWGLILLLAMAAIRGPGEAAHEAAASLLHEYLPFIVLIGAFFTVAGGVRLTGTLRGTPAVNSILLFAGTIAASLIGTAGAAMLVARPLVRANRGRRHNRHVFIFCIILVANIGGTLLPPGNPPLLLGFLHGVPFFWPTIHMLAPTSLAVAVLLLLFYLLDSYLHRRDPAGDPPLLGEVEKLGLRGRRNLVLLLAIPLVIMIAGTLPPRIAVTVDGIAFDGYQLAAEACLIGIAALSLRATPRALREANDFSWEVMIEVAILFAAIFLTITPVLDFVRSGAAGEAIPLLARLNPAGGPDDRLYFWASGLLSAFLDNAPTYLIFFNAAGGDGARLAGELSSTLLAISAGASYFGALTYVGNAPNFLIKGIAEEAGIAMPGFFSFLVVSAALLLPLFAAISLIFF